MNIYVSILDWYLTYQSGSTSFSKTDKKQGSKMLNWIMVQCPHTHVPLLPIINNSTLQQDKE